MENDKQINVNIPADYNGKPIIIETIKREGRAANINEPKKFHEGGLSLVSIHKYITGRTFSNIQDENEGIIIYSLDPENAYIEFQQSESNQLAPSLIASLYRNPDLEDFKINKDFYFNQNDLIRFIKKHAHCFTDPKKAVEFINNLRNFEVRYEQVILKEDNRQGKTKDLEENAINFAKGAIELNWSLTVPLFKGTEPVNIQIDIEIQKGNRNLPEFGFYSMDLDLLYNESAKKLVLAEVNKFTNFVCLEKV